jgi:hypothetical protein
MGEFMALLLGHSSTMSLWDRWAAFRSIPQFETAVLRGSKFCITERGFFSMLPEQAEVGDRIFVVKGDQEKATVRTQPCTTTPGNQKGTYDQ